MRQNAKLKLELVDVYGKRLGERVDIELRHQTLSERKVFRAVDASKIININDLDHLLPSGLYRLTIDPPSYLPVSRFVNIKASGTTELSLVFPVDPKKVSSVRFPKYKDLPSETRAILDRSDALTTFPGKSGEALYDVLDDTRRAGFLNIVAKASHTRLGSGNRTVLSYIEQLTQLRGDRFLAVVAGDLRDEVKNSVVNDLFHDADSALHHPPVSFHSVGSFKTNDAYGNLQLTFFTDGSTFVADIDIDDAAGLGHVFQVVRNSATRRQTHPYDIHEILVRHQHIDPGYNFITSI